MRSMNILIKMSVGRIQRQKKRVYQGERIDARRENLNKKKPGDLLLAFKEITLLTEFQTCNQRLITFRIRRI